MKTNLFIFLNKILDIFSSKQDHKGEKMKKYSNYVGIAFIWLLIICTIGYIMFPYTFSSDSWIVKFLIDVFTYLKNS